MKKTTFAIVATSLVTLAVATAPAEARKRHGYRGASGIMENNTGGRPSRVISRGPTGADTITNNSAAGGNAARPALAVPNSSGGSSR